LLEAIDERLAPERATRSGVPSEVGSEFFLLREERTRIIDVSQQI